MYVIGLGNPGDLGISGNGYLSTHSKQPQKTITDQEHKYCALYFFVT